MTIPVPVKRPEPVLDAAKLAGLISGLVLAVGACFVVVGWASPQQVQTWAVATGGVVTALGAVLAYLLPVILAKGARAQVTPLESPRTVDGTPLAPKQAQAVLTTYDTASAPLRKLIEGGLASLDPAGTVAPPAPAPSAPTSSSVPAPAVQVDSSPAADESIPQPDDVPAAADPAAQVTV